MAVRLFNPQSKEPFKLSRSKVDMFIDCPRCFYLDRRLGIKRPGGFPFTLNNAVDYLLKKEFDIHRAKKQAHPLMEAYGIDAVPYNHERMNEWRHNFTGVQFLHKPTNFFLFGAIDDLWKGADGKLMVVDYKATSINKEVTLDDEWKIVYKRQMEFYQWLLRQNGFDVSDTGYFVYVNGNTDKEAFDAKLEFDVKILPYEGKGDWVEDTVVKAHKTLMSDSVPEASPDCEYCSYGNKVINLKNQK
jgi:CRISPR/Cas system-associated exonuclease Cas4 (RecB family)